MEKNNNFVSQQIGHPATREEEDKMLEAAIKESEQLAQSEERKRRSTLLQRPPLVPSGWKQLGKLIRTQPPSGDCSSNVLAVPTFCPWTSRRSKQGGAESLKMTSSMESQKFDKKKSCRETLEFYLKTFDENHAASWAEFATRTDRPAEPLKIVTLTNSRRVQNATSKWPPDKTSTLSSSSADSAGGMDGQIDSAEEVVPEDINPAVKPYRLSTLAFVPSGCTSTTSGSVAERLYDQAFPVNKSLSWNAPANRSESGFKMSLASQQVYDFVNEFESDDDKGGATLQSGSKSVKRGKTQSARRGKK